MSKHSVQIMQNKSVLYTAHCGSKREKTEKSIYSNNMHVLYIKLEVFWVVESEFGVKITIAPL